MCSRHSSYKIDFNKFDFLHIRINSASAEADRPNSKFLELHFDGGNSP